ncbi:D-alanyl-D-alanine carboxypeptidase family protein [Candidatus Parcubacteria bacterium]|nr:MAG: D-alanyl-D-alanine carboxypeptidase family protein [Candidatus Parcubacteria bacterium]
MQQQKSHETVVISLSIALAALTVAVAIGAWMGYERFMALSMRVETLEAEVATTTDRLARGLEETHSTLASALEEEQERSEKLQTQFGTISDSVDVLEKLSTLDGQLLKKYSKVYFLNENYMPEQLSVIPKEYTYNEEREYSVASPILRDLTNMLRAAKRAGIEIYVASAYRSFGEQGALKGQYSMTYGEGSAGQFSADQGYSEHQLGTTLDFTTTGLGGGLAGFGNTPAFEWLQENAYKYGFILSYPEGNQYYMYEPWHWRFVGEDLADDLHDEGMNFYDMDQRELDKYLATIFD